MKANDGDTDRAKRAALLIVAELGLTEPSEIDLEAIAFHKGVYVREASMKGCEARLLRKGNRGIISVRNDLANEGRKRFSIGHELGHWILHPNASQWWVSSAEAIHGYAGSQLEIEANAFAAELIMPTPIFKPYCHKGTFGFPLVEKLAATFHTSLIATALRIVEESPERCCVVVSSDETVRWSRRSRKLPDFEYYIPSGFRLRQKSKAWSSTFEEQERIAKVPSYAWFPNLPRDRGYEVWEESRYLDTYGSVLTLLSINEY